MGDRGNICMEIEDGTEIYLYTHWHGSELKSILQSALIRGRSRWSDESYLARIIFSEMIKDSVEELTGYGISTSLAEGGVIKVNVAAQEVWHGTKHWSFEEYCNSVFD